jgi:hypothetical protein
MMFLVEVVLNEEEAMKRKTTHKGGRQGRGEGREERE